MTAAPVAPAPVAPAPAAPGGPRPADSHHHTYITRPTRTPGTARTAKESHP
ncbi:hypothetical protein [Streptomyces sp. NPDC093225]|uniref:hypothetical protein n=1 Tax=Streptomyces sp. NPDC093225 TaxID=3366034 RepID=UPI0037FBB638